MAPDAGTSDRIKIRHKVINTTIGQWMRAVDAVLDEYVAHGTLTEDSEQVAKLAVLMMLNRWYDPEEYAILSDSNELRIPKKISETGKYEIHQILDGITADEDDLSLLDEEGRPL